MITTRALLVTVLLAAGAAAAEAPVALGSRRELFVDDGLIARLAGGAQARLHHPEPKEIVLVHDAPWEGSGSGYHSVFQDGDRYRMYYKAWQLSVTPGKVNTKEHPLWCAYAETQLQKKNGRKKMVSDLEKKT